MNGFEMSLEEFERLEDLSERPHPKILENVSEKTKKYDDQRRARKYNYAYKRYERIDIDRSTNKKILGSNVIDFSKMFFQKKTKSKIPYFFV